VIAALEKLGATLDGFLTDAEQRLATPQRAALAGVGLGLAVISGGAAVFALLLVVLVQLFA
jgi:hypothetical protein